MCGFEYKKQDFDFFFSYGNVRLHLQGVILMSSSGMNRFMPWTDPFRFHA